MRIADVLKNKGSWVATVSPGSLVEDLLATLSEANVGAAVVADGDVVVGIVSERDVVRRLADRGAAALQAPTADIMTNIVVTCSPEDTVEGMMNVMTARRIRHVPVMSDQELTGIVSIGDMVKAHIGELEKHRDQLEAYISRG